MPEHSGGSAHFHRGCFPLQEDSSCLQRYDFKANVFPHVSQVKGFLVEWVWVWARKLDLSAKALWHTSHWYGLSPVVYKPSLWKSIRKGHFCGATNLYEFECGLAKAKVSKMSFHRDDICTFGCGFLDALHKLALRRIPCGNAGISSLSCQTMT